ncbi:MAG: hypothetical protein R3Y32_03650 [Bacillota bacterium]
MKNRWAFCFLCLGAILQVVIFPAVYIDAFYFGLTLFCEKLLPLLFPFFVFCGVLLKTGILLEISQKFLSAPFEKIGLSRHFPYVFLLAFLSGYPMNAKLACDLMQSGEIDNREGESLAFSTSCSGILFVVATVGTIMLGSTLIGVLLMLCHISACLLGYFSLCFFDKIFFHQPKITAVSQIKIKRDTSSEFSIFESFTQSVATALQTILLVGAYVCIFSVATKMLEVIGLFSVFNTQISGVIRGIFEITQGISTLATLEISPLNLAFIVALISFGGVSINMQSLGILLPFGISSGRYFTLKTLQMCWGFIVTFIFFSAFFA